MRCSVICPTYNRGDFLFRAVGSFIKQDYADKELIIVNDGGYDIDISGDNIKYFKLEKNGGQAAAQNYGIAQSSGELICTLDDDDVLEVPSSLSERVGVFMRDDTIDMIWTSAYEVYHDKVIYQKAIPLNMLDEWRGDKIFINSMMWRKRIHEKIGYFDSGLTSNEDWEWKINCLINCKCECRPEINSMRHTIHPEMRSDAHRRSGELKKNEAAMREKLINKYGSIFNE